MKPLECPRETEIFQKISANKWPDCSAHDLLVHVEGCSVCKDLVLVAQALVESDAISRREAPVPSAGIIWWRAEMRMRREAVRAASRPIKFIQAAAGVCAGGLALALLSRLNVAALLGAFVERSLSVFVAAAAALVLLPFALYWVFSDD